MLGFSVGRDASASHRLQRSPLAWSFTRHRLLNGPRRCERAIYWRYVGGRGGHDATRAPPPAPTAWALRHLTSLPVFVGTVLHTALRQAVIAVVDDRRRPDARRLLNGPGLTDALRRLAEEDGARARAVTPALSALPNAEVVAALRHAVGSLEGAALQAVNTAARRVGRVAASACSER